MRIQKANAPVAILVGVVFSIFSARAFAGTLTMPEQVSLGEVYLGEEKRVEFEVENTSDADITITGIRKTCTCAEASLIGSDVIGAKEKRKIAAVLRPSRLGELLTALEIAWRDSAGQVVKKKVAIRSSTVSVMTLASHLVEFGTISGNQEQTRTCVLKRGTSSRTWDILKPDVSDDQFAARVEEQDKDTWIVHVTVKPMTMSYGGFRKTILLRCQKDGAVLPGVIPIEVSGAVGSDILAVPSSAFFGKVVKGGVAERTINLTSDVVSLRDVVVKTSGKDIVASVVASGARQAKLSVELRNNADTGPIVGIITLSSPSLSQEMRIRMLAYSVDAISQEKISSAK